MYLLKQNNIFSLKLLNKFDRIVIFENDIHFTDFALDVVLVFTKFRNVLINRSFLIKTKENFWCSVWNNEISLA